MDFSLAAASRAYSLVAVCRLLTAAASLVAEHQLWGAGAQQLRLLDSEHRLSSCGPRALLLHGPRDLLRSGIELMSPALAGGLLTTVPPGKPLHVYFNI